MQYYNSIERFNYFYAYLAQQIKAGVKQKEIAKDIGKTAQYINKIYLKKQKSCPEDVQELISGYFHISIEELLEKGKAIFVDEQGEGTPSIAVFQKEKTPLVERRSIEPQELINQLSNVAIGIKACGDKLEEVHELEDDVKELKNKLKIYESIFSELHEGISFFNAKREFVFSSNRWGLLDDFDVSDHPSIDAMLLHLRKFVKNFDDVVNQLFGAFDTKQEAKIKVKLTNKKSFLFRVVPIFDEDIFEGLLLINTPCQL